MPEEIRVRQPAAASRQDPAGASAETSQPNGSSKMPWVVLIVIVLLLLVFGALFRDKLFGKNSATTASTSGGKSGVYQAVFLTNGQVYFGKISNTEDNYVTLDDIYYLQVVQPPLQGSQQASSTAQTPQISLIKLGSELHGPVDEMHISRSQILFFEDLKSDGQVVKAIMASKNGTGK